MMKNLQIKQIIEHSTFTIKIAFFILLSAYRLGAQPYVGEIRIFAGNFAPNGWFFCDGQSLSIAEYETLFVLIGTTYGGDGQTTFNLPDLRGRAALHQGTGPGLSTYNIGQQGGVEQVTLTTNQIPVHGHNLVYNPAKGESISPNSNFPARNAAGAVQYGGLSNDNAHASSLGESGGNQSHENRQPFLAVNYIISMFGVFPSQSKGSNGSDYKLLNPDGTIVDFESTRGIEPYISEILIFPFSFAPQGFTLCNGQLLPINQNQALFSLLGTNFGGNGTTNFALPDLRGRVPVGLGTGNGSSWTQGQRSGSETETLLSSHLPAHNHSFSAVNSAGNSNNPAGNLLAISSSDIPSFSAISSGSNVDGIAATGSSQAHENKQPFLTLSYCIALQGIWPSFSKENESPEETRGYDAFLGEIMIIPINYTPQGYASCSGQLLPIASYSALSSLLGTTYGGNGTTNFGLPDLQGKVAIHKGQGPGLSLYDLGETGGTESVQLTISQMPTHTHLLKVATSSISDSPKGFVFGPYPGGFSSSTANITLNAQTVSTSSATIPHNNIMPSLGINFFIATEGVFPTRP
jgi:microcystin-dependent protein